MLELEGGPCRGADRGMTEPLFSYDEVDAILRLDGHNDYVGISAIDGLIAAVVAGPVHIEPDGWLPQIFAGSMPNTVPGTPSHRLVQTILHRHDEVADVLRQRPATYQPMFMNHEGAVITEHWAVGFMLGVGLRPNAWAPFFLSDFRSTLAPILSIHELGRRMMPDVSDVELDRIKATAHFVVADVVTALYRRCAKQHAESRRLWKLRHARKH